MTDYPALSLLPRVRSHRLLMEAEPTLRLMAENVKRVMSFLSNYALKKQNRKLFGKRETKCL